jgi:hypothetical protein
MNMLFGVGHWRGMFEYVWHRFFNEAVYLVQSKK